MAEKGVNMMYEKEFIGRAKASTNGQHFYDNFGCLSAIGGMIYSYLQRESFLGCFETELQWFLRV
jgi:hypothetical protein